MQVEDVRRIEAEHALWRAGSIRHILDDHQLRIYDPIRDWQTRRVNELRSGMMTGIHRVFVVKAGRQVGKTHGTNTLKVETGLNQDGTCLVATSTEVALKELVIPVIHSICSTAPDDLRPKFISHRWGMRAAFYFPSTGFMMKLVGVDENPDGLRGPGLKGGALFTEAAFIQKLEYAYNSIVAPQFSRFPEADAIFESSAAKDPNHPFKRVFEPDAQRRRAYVFMTIDDNKTLSEEVKRELVESARAINPDDAEREYYCVETRDRSRVLVPEFDAERHVVAAARPAHACGIAAMDPGMRDLFFVGWGYWDAARAKLVVEHDWSGRNKSTGFVAQVIRDVEHELYGPCAELAAPRRTLLDPREELRRILRVLSGEEEPDQGAGLGLTPPVEGLCWWNGYEFDRNPVLRVSDTDARLIGDLNQDQGIQCCATEKDDAEAALYALRNAFRDDKIEINPRCVDLIRHLTVGQWNERRTDWQRYHDGMEAELYGHFDGVAMLVYMWRMVQTIRNWDPMPPKFTDRHNPDVMFIPESWREQQTSALEEFFA
ncbi:MAG: hypothetical protein JXP37_07990 [Coriobacteriia bacterium]|nr:hypothetical protein [Coriobacteriia bacterium]